MQYDMSIFAVNWYLLVLFVILPIIFTLWVVSKSCSGYSAPSGYAVPEPRPTDGSDGLSVAHGAEVSYWPSESASASGGFPVGGLGHGGRGSFGRPRKDKQDAKTE